MAIVLLGSWNKAQQSDDEINLLIINSEQITLPEISFNYEVQNIPNYLLNARLNRADNTPAHNPIDNEGATLGRVLFYDKILSLNKTISCSSCHSPSSGFSDPKTFSLGFEGEETARHSMALANARFYAKARFFWDERASSLEEQALEPIQDHIEMGLNLDSLISRMNKTDYYPPLFSNAFGNNEITESKIALSLAQFIRSLISFNSKYDIARSRVANSSVNFPNFTDSENRGKSLFFSDRWACGLCHGTDAFIAPGPRNNGLEAISTDLGLGGNSGSLKNIGISAPYMHEGRFTNLLDVVNHYNDGVQNHPNLSPPLRLANGQIRRLNLTNTEKNDLIAFLHTLTDDVMINDEKFSDPFSE